MTGARKGSGISSSCSVGARLGAEVHTRNSPVCRRIATSRIRATSIADKADALTTIARPGGSLRRKSRGGAVSDNVAYFGDTVRFRKCATVPLSIHSAIAPLPFGPLLTSFTISVG